MEIGKPTSLVPPDSRARNDGKYADIYKALQALKDGQWLPVTFDTQREAYNFRVATATHRTLDLQAKQRGDTVYVRPRRKGTVRGE